MFPTSNAGTTSPAPYGAPGIRLTGWRRRVETARRIGPMQWIRIGLITVGLLALGAFGSSLLIARAYQFLGQEWLEQSHSVRAALPGTIASRITAPRPASGSLLGRLELGRLGMSVMVREGTDSRSLMLAAGHLSGTALPGEDGNVVIAAHRDTFFRPLREVRPADTITLETIDGKISYVVEETLLVKPERTDLLRPTAERMLTLVTCYPFNYVGHAPLRFIVRARQVDP
jgi:sortase A